VTAPREPGRPAPVTPEPGDESARRRCLPALVIPEDGAPEHRASDAVPALRGGLADSGVSESGVTHARGRHARITRSGPRQRLDGVDAARAVALAGMASVHILPVMTAAGTETFAGAVAAGRASALFAVLAGVGVALSTGGRTPPARGRPHAAAAAGLLVRGGLVTLVGLALVQLDPPVAVILAYYGLLFCLATPLLRLRARTLGVLAAVWCVFGPVASHVLRAGREAWPGDQPGFAALAAPGELLRELTLTGYYPVLPWLTYLLAGMAVGRLDLRSPRVAAALVGGGASVAVTAWVGSALLLGPGGGAQVLGSDLAERRYGTVPTDTWWWLAVEAPHTGTPFDLAHTTGTALMVLGVMLLLARAAPVLVWPLAAVGAIPLTLYTLHVTALALFPVEAARAAGTSAGDLLVTHLLAALVIGVAVRTAGRRGPLEAVVRALSGGARRAVAGGG
jgi:uncharacterized membrane protein